MIPTPRQTQTCEYCGYTDTSVYTYREGTLCVECWRLFRGRSLMDAHHLYGRPNPETVLISANLHAAITEKKAAWPKILLEPDDPLLSIASSLRTISDFSAWVSSHLLEYSIKALGFNQWINDLQAQAPNDRANPLLYSNDPVIYLVRVIFSIYSMLARACTRLEDYSNFLIALQQCLVEAHGKQYWDVFNITPLKPGK